jgi:nucleotide-binding universal stress UspA family protein
MKALLRRITFATDGSAASIKALEFLLTTLSPDHASGRERVQVTVVHILARRPLAPIQFRFQAPWIRSEKKVKDAANKLVDQIVQQLTKAGFMAQPVLKIGDPAEEIMKVSSQRHADLIVMGAKGLSAIDRILLGSVSTRVVQYANCPVLVVR